jgi:dTDP-4-dehydrorhamnose 3,5-epimerase-like enzyme
MPLVEVKRLAIPEVMYFRYRVFEDERGFFAELWKRTEYLAAGLPFDFVQVNLSYSRPYVVRGLHYQLKPSEQGKLVFVVRGRVFDVAVDIRRGLAVFRQVGRGGAGARRGALDPAWLCPRLPGLGGDVLPVPRHQGVRPPAR